MMDVVVLAILSFCEPIIVETKNNTGMSIL